MNVVVPTKEDVLVQHARITYESVQAVAGIRILAPLAPEPGDLGGADGESAGLLSHRQPSDPRALCDRYRSSRDPRS